MGTHWEQQKPKKFNNPRPPKYEKAWAPWVPRLKWARHQLWDIASSSVGTNK